MLKCGHDRTATSPSRRDDWHILPARIKHYNHHVIGANWSVDGPEPWFGYGFLTIYSPDGTILATSHKLYGTDIVYADLVR